MIDQGWIDFVKAVQKAIASRSPGSPVVMMVPQFTQDREATVHFLHYGLTAGHLLPMVMYLVLVLERECPESATVRELKSHCDRLLGTSMRQPEKKDLN